MNLGPLRLSTLLSILTVLMFTLNCGSGTSTTLLVKPPTGNAETNFTDGTYTTLGLDAVFSDGKVPTSVKWETSAACVALDPNNNTSSHTFVACNFTCGGKITATITATAEGKSGHSTVTCTWR
jgi:hypothetical protein